mmetsp:Transcript_47241/g.75885  ORF Transcript_47241/g.75885 Transcript_47241/m.75885 type:complete len:658 (+) Transcript_47241:112-2085(+)
MKAVGAASNEEEAGMFELIKTSTSQFLALQSVSRHVKINEEAVAKFAATIGPKELQSATRTPFPLKFKDRASELNFLGLLHALNFGSGYRELLHQHCNRGAYETIAHGCIGAHISQTINADFLLNLKLVDIPQLFGIPLDMDVEIKPAIHSTKHSPVRPLAAKIVAVCNKMGRTMRARQWEGFSDFVMETLEDIRGVGPGGQSKQRKGSSRPAADFVKELGKAFPSVFKDVYEFKQQSDDSTNTIEEGKENKQDPASTSTTVGMVHIYKKAQLLVNELHRRFKDEDPSLFDFEDIDNMTVCADNVLPAALRHYGILEYSEELGRRVDSRCPLKNREMECAMRAGSIVACEMILKELKARSSDWNTKKRRKNVGENPGGKKLEATYSHPKCRPLSDSDLKKAREQQLEELEDHSYGCIVLSSSASRSSSENESEQQLPQHTCVLLIKPKKTSKGYVFPKGHPDPGEKMEDCACRETREETGVTPSGHLQSAYAERGYSFIGKLHSDKWKKHAAYPDEAKRPILVVHKIVRLYFAWCSTLNTSQLRPNSEAHEVVWVPLQEAEQKLTFQEDKDMLREVLRTNQVMTKLSALKWEIPKKYQKGSAGDSKQGVDNRRDDFEDDPSKLATSDALDFYLWREVGKLPQVRKEPRHLMQDTVFY